jgi:hypothetical protein
MLVRMWEKRNTSTVLVGMQISATAMGINMEVSQKTKNRTTIPDPMIHSWAHIWRNVLQDAIDHLAHPCLFQHYSQQWKFWRQSRCSKTDEWIKRMWYIYTIEFYIDIKKNKIMLFAGKWMELENTMLNEVNQAPKVKSLYLPSYVETIS